MAEDSFHSGCSVAILAEYLINFNSRSVTKSSYIWNISGLKKMKAMQYFQFPTTFRRRAKVRVGRRRSMTQNDFIASVRCGVASRNCCGV